MLLALNDTFEQSWQIGSCLVNGICIFITLLLLCTTCWYLSPKYVKYQRHKQQHHIHTTTKHLTQDMMRLGNIDSVLEPVNFFHGKVGQPLIGDFFHNITSQPGNPRNARHAVVPPDIQATTTPLVDKLSMPAEQQDLLVLSLKLKHKTSAPQDITTTTKTLTQQQINVHER